MGNKSPLAMTPLEYSRSTFSGVWYKQPSTQILQGKAYQKKMQGYIAVVDGTEKEYVAPGHLVSVELDSDENAHIIPVWCNTEEMNAAAGNAYTLNTLRNWYFNGKLSCKGKAMDYDEYCRKICDYYGEDGVFLISKHAFFQLFGLYVDPFTEKVKNPLKLQTTMTRRTDYEQHKRPERKK